MKNPAILSKILPDFSSATSLNSASSASFLTLSNASFTVSSAKLLASIMSLRGSTFICSFFSFFLPLIALIKSVNVNPFFLLVTCLILSNILPEYSSSLSDSLSVLSSKGFVLLVFSFISSTTAGGKNSSSFLLEVGGTPLAILLIPFIISFMFSIISL